LRTMTRQPLQQPRRQPNCGPHRIRWWSGQS
jgi:hypothetical protein